MTFMNSIEAKERIFYLRSAETTCCAERPSLRPPICFPVPLGHARLGALVTVKMAGRRSAIYRAGRGRSSHSAVSRRPSQELWEQYLAERHPSATLWPR